MPTSISHIGGRARVNEPGRYRKKNNKNLMAQGLPTYVGMPQPLRNLIAKRVKSSDAITKGTGTGCSTTTIVEYPNSFSFTIESWHNEEIIVNPSSSSAFTFKLLSIYFFNSCNRCSTII